MTFLHTWAFGFLGAVPVIVLLYLLKVKRRPATVSTLMFWQRVFVENRRRALFQRLRQLLSLLFHLLIFLLILLALAKPEWSRFAGAGPSTVLIADTRARMRAVEAGGETRFEKARRELAAYVRHAGGQNTMALLACGPDAEVAVPFSDDEKTLQQGVADLMATDAGGDLDAAIKLARALLASRAGEKRIVVFTDRPLTKNAGVESVVVGQPLDNVAITNFTARSQLNSPQTAQVLLALRNFGEKAARGNVEIYQNDALVDVKPFDLAPGGAHTELFPFVSEGGRLRARLDRTDALAVDNEALAVLPGVRPRRVLLVTRGNWFIEKMLEADESTKWELLTPDAFTPELAKSFDAVILDDALPAGFDLAAARGNFLFLKQTPFGSGAALDQPLVSETDARSPLLRLVALQNVTFIRSARLAVPQSAGWKFETPLRSFDAPLIVTGVRGDQRVAAFAFDVAESDLPLRVAFPLLMSNTLQWLAGGVAEQIHALRAGKALPLAANQRVLSPSGQPIAESVFRPVRNGWYSVETGADKSLLAVNTFSESESDLRFADGATPNAPPRFAAVRFTAWPLWQYLALAALALFTLEWWLFHRRRTE